MPIFLEIFFRMLYNKLISRQIVTKPESRTDNERQESEYETADQGKVKSK